MNIVFLNKKEIKKDNVGDEYIRLYGKKIKLNKLPFTIKNKEMNCNLSLKCKYEGTAEVYAEFLPL